MFLLQRICSLGRGTPCPDCCSLTAHILSLFTLELAIAAGFAVLGSAIRGFGAIILAPVFVVWAPGSHLGRGRSDLHYSAGCLRCQRYGLGQITPMLLGIACITPPGSGPWSAWIQVTHVG